MSLPRGALVGPDEIRSLLGEGGTGEVYEALAIAALSHPNIVTLCAVDEHEGRPLLAMEKVDRRPRPPQ